MFGKLKKKNQKTTSFNSLQHPLSLLLILPLFIGSFFSIRVFFPYPKSYACLDNSFLLSSMAPELHFSHWIRHPCSTRHVTPWVWNSSDTEFHFIKLAKKSLAVFIFSPTISLKKKTRGKEGRRKEQEERREGETNVCRAAPSMLVLFDPSIVKNESCKCTWVQREQSASENTGTRSAGRNPGEE